MKYCDHYIYLLTGEKAKKYITDEELWIKLFGSDPIWAKQ